MYKDMSSEKIANEYNKLDRNDPRRIQINNILRNQNDFPPVISNLSNMFFHNTHDSIYDNFNREIDQIKSSFNNLNSNSSFSSYSNSYLNNNGKEFTNISTSNNINGKKTKETRKIYREGDKYVEIISMDNGKYKIKGNRELVNKVKNIIKNQ